MRNIFRRVLGALLNVLIPLEHKAIDEGFESYHRQAKLDRVNGHQKGRGRRTLYTLHKNIRRTTYPTLYEAQAAKHAIRRYQRYVAKHQGVRPPQHIVVNANQAAKALLGR